MFSTVTVKSVIAGSPAHKAGVKSGDVIISVGGNNITDVLDYDFYTAEEKFTLLVHRGPELIEFKIKKEEYEQLGCEFETYLIDKKQCCRNKCVFCFIDQNPKGMRESIYFKDDDSRMSFLAGNYITLTNLSDSDVERIIKMHVSPMNISVHTTNPELRVKMMKNKFAGDSLSYIKRFAENDIWMNIQIVLCPEINDKIELERTLTDLEKFFPAVQSIAVVPVGLTKHRDGLYPLREFTKEEAAETIKTVNKFGDRFLKKYGFRTCYASDEFYLKAQEEIPSNEFYEDYPQFDNGVGLIRSFVSEVEFCIEQSCEKARTPEEFSIVTGYGAYGTLDASIDSICKKLYKGKRDFVNLYKIKNTFFGESVNVAGLVTGGDIITQLKGKKIGKRLYIPKVMLRHEQDMFLDDVSVNELSEELGTEVVLTDTNGTAFFELFE